MTLKKIIVLAIVCLFAVFVLQNAATVQVRLLVWKAEAPRALVLLMTFASGLAAGALLAWQRKGKDRK